MPGISLVAMGVMSRLLYDLIPPHLDPPRAPPSFSKHPGCCNWTYHSKRDHHRGAVGRSAVNCPLTGTWGDANRSGFFGPKLKVAGFDIVLFHGISKRPVMLGPNLFLSETWTAPVKNCRLVQPLRSGYNRPGRHLGICH